MTTPKVGAPPPDNLDRWFATDVLIHEAALTRFLQRQLRDMAPGDVADFRQDVYVMVYEHAKLSQPDCAKSYMFSCARNYVCDFRRRRRIVAIDYTDDMDLMNGLTDAISPERRLSGAQEMRILADAFNDLPDVNRDVIWLRRVEGLSQTQVAEMLHLKEGTIESHLCRGLKVLADVIFQRT